MPTLPAVEHELLWHEEAGAQPGLPILRPTQNWVEQSCARRRIEWSNPALATGLTERRLCRRPGMKPASPACIGPSSAVLRQPLPQAHPRSTPPSALLPPKPSHRPTDPLAWTLLLAYPPLCLDRDLYPILLNEIPSRQVHIFPNLEMATGAPARCPKTIVQV